MAKPQNKVNREIEIWSRDKTPDVILGHAREMRKNPTKAEQLLWRALRGRNLSDLKFRRQQPMKGYILDFYCEAARLGVEVDGEIHLGERQKRYDQERTEYLAEYGIKILRFKNEEIINTIMEVLNTIEKEATKRIKR
ncbi:MAG: endonuclease domain-containing protein [Cytophagales bacterium]|jgi:very-short-patch-repair endonuclease|nr:endonuclease domain-containing protein [Cytophagales bacterium]MCA6368687.1 endonuclease domain-containing protein [Cytophagales bacterium]MCA6370800.1 endonuclease domain-containing protein [Cytophagales bacterium]MCA6376957.1 endonuclease domain-containing protein [Cytophagales bacterium]MCA6383120.1 endonuclease domain-containing protein [Cytophagales bacterium]